MIQISMCGHRGLHKLNTAEKLLIAALRLWRICRAERLATLPELHQRLAPAGGAMLVVPLDDFFKQIATWRSCPHRSKSRYSDQLICDEVATLDLLQVADGQFEEVREMGPNWNAPTLLMISAWTLGRQFATELGLRFGRGLQLQPTRDDGARSFPGTHPSPFRGTDLSDIAAADALTGADLGTRRSLYDAIVEDPLRNLPIGRRRQT